MLKSLRIKIVRLLLATAVLTILIAPPAALPAYAACATSASDNCVR